MVSFPQNLAIDLEKHRDKQVYHGMQDKMRSAAKASVQVLLLDLKSCSSTYNLEKGRKIHAEAIQCGHDFNIYVATALINMYAKCGTMADARQVFDSMRGPNVVSWTALISGYAENGQGLAALELFARMRTEGLVPDSVTFIAALKACTSIAVRGWAKCRDRCKALHKLAIENDCDADIYLQNTLLGVYTKCGSMVDAHHVFDCLKQPTVVSWNALILGYADNGQGLIALELFTRMRTDGPEPNPVTFVAALKACTSLERTSIRDRGKALHELVTENGCNTGIYVESTLVDVYSKCGNVEDARLVFDTMKRPNVVSCTALVLGYTDNGQAHTALELFIRMRTAGPAPDLVTYAVALKACSVLGALEFGRTIHSEIGSGNNLDVVLVTCLVDFYAKCGSLVEAQRVFDLNPGKRDMITWNALMAGYCSCGDNESVLSLFEGMQAAGFRPDGVTLLCILTCCSHAGLVKKGKECFDAISTKYGIVPTVDHCNCMLNILGRADKLDAAMALLRCMVCSPNDVTWTTILSACRKWKNVEIGRLAFQSLINKDAGSYVLMGQIYGSRGMLLEQQVVMEMRKNVEAWKNLGATCWTNEVGEVHAFVGEDNQHPKISEVIQNWESLMRKHELNSDNDGAFCSHSERLALACALINTEPRKTIRIVKNLRVCGECHVALGFVSKLESRTIICRDASRIHVFVDGQCACLMNDDHSH